MKTMTMLVALVCAFTFAAGNAVVAPAQAPSLQSAISVPQSPAANHTEAVTIPRLLSYQGRLTDTLGVPVADTLYLRRVKPGDKHGRRGWCTARRGAGAV